MKQHPVPQDVTGFQFKLVGDMTIRQFIYLAGGGIIGYLIFNMTLIPSVIRIPVAALLALGGAAIAFVPYQQRPLDRWVTSFFTSIYHPTQFVWRKQPNPPDVLQRLTPQPASSVQRPSEQSGEPSAAQKQQRRQAAQFLATMSGQQDTFISPAEDSFAQHVNDLFHTLTRNQQAAKPQPNSTPAQHPAPSQQRTVSAQNPKQNKQNAPQTDQVATTPQEPPQDKRLDARTQQLNEHIKQLQQELTQQSTTKERFLQLQQELSQLLQEKERLLDELVSLRRDAAHRKPAQTVKPSEYVADNKSAQKTVKMVPDNLAQKRGLPVLTSLPNVVTGIVKTPEATLLPNILVTVKDHDGMPVRALKTNKLGQFAASSPLANGTFTLEIEDPQKRYQFVPIEITLSGRVLPALEITARGERELSREKLHKELFGNHAL